MTKLIWEGEASHFSIHSGEYDGYVNRHIGRETTPNKNGTLTRTELFDNLFPNFQGDILVFDDKDYKLCEIESTWEYYDYIVHFENVIKVEQGDLGHLYITIHRLEETTNE